MDALQQGKHAEGVRGVDRNAKPYKWIKEPLYGCVEDVQRIKGEGRTRTDERQLHVGRLGA